MRVTPLSYINGPPKPTLKSENSAPFRFVRSAKSIFMIH